uniref:OTU domain-containing protein n=1 Tax=Lactuca sativa TaxID=4236 RepID=A0A9R1XRE4_LACSA|nr:hypothetical protein LSAT_V11C300104230 [Lactuca sativa]
MFDLNQQPELERHNTEFQPYVSSIQNVEGDGHCGFRAVVVALGYSEDYWHQIWTDLYGELLMHIDDYIVIFANDINTISETLNFYGTPMIRKYLMIMPDSGILIANNGPQDFPNHSIINIALLNDFHYVKVDLQEGHLMANVSWIWNIHKSTRSTG